MLDPAGPSPTSPAHSQEDYAEAAERLRPRLRNVARRVLGDTPEIDDVVQEALVQGWVALDRFRGEARLSTWLHRIVTNAALMQLRRGRRRPEVLLPTLVDPGDLAGPVPLPPAETPEDLVISRERAQRLREAIAHQDLPSRELLERCCVQERSLGEVSTQLGISRSAVKTRLFRLRRRLREQTDGATARGPEQTDGATARAPEEAGA